MNAEPAPGVRLQKVLAAAGVGSRRRCEELITAGRVTVDGEVIRVLGTRVDPAQAVVHVDGVLQAVSPDVVVVAVNKPIGMLSAMRDDRGRPCLGDLVVGRGGGRLFHVGRLDADTSGLLLLTNTGDLAHRLTHPSFGLDKTYVAEVRPALDARALTALRRGVAIEGRPLEITKMRLVGSRADRSAVRLTIHEGRNRVIRRAFHAVGRDVISLLRVSFGPIKLGKLPPGAVRTLSAAEVRALYAAADAGARPERAPASRSM